MKAAIAVVPRVSLGADYALKSPTHTSTLPSARALPLGFWLGWLAIVAVLGGLELDVPPDTARSSSP
jgi:hypothetical protein